MQSLFDALSALRPEGGANQSMYPDTGISGNTAFDYDADMADMDRNYGVGDGLRGRFSEPEPTTVRSMPVQSVAPHEGISVNALSTFENSRPPRRPSVRGNVVGHTPSAESPRVVIPIPSVSQRDVVAQFTESGNEQDTRLRQAALNSRILRGQAPDMNEISSAGSRMARRVVRLAGGNPERSLGEMTRQTRATQTGGRSEPARAGRTAPSGRRTAQKNTVVSPQLSDPSTYPVDGALPLNAVLAPEKAIDYQGARRQR